METNLEFIKIKDQISESKAFGASYQEYLEAAGSDSFTSPLFEEIQAVYDNIVVKHQSITNYQKDVLVKIFEAFNKIRKEVDPNRLKSFNHCINEDEELLLYRESDRGLTNIIINPDECTAYSFIGNNGEQILEFFYADADFEALTLKFFSN